MQNILDVFFPKTCSICKRKGTYLCERCKKLFINKLPECYICRRISSYYKTHTECKNSKKNSSLDCVFISWEYNSLTSDLLKKYKYGYVYDMSDSLSRFFVECISKSNFANAFENTLLTNIPISSNRLRERGFNQTLNISKEVSEYLNVSFSDTLLRRKDTYDHQSLRDRDERKNISKNDFVVKSNFDLSSYKSITIVDDVMTTGITLESACELLKDTFGKDLIVNGICMFRGRPYYL
jgi:ComF family protein